MKWHLWQSSSILGNYLVLTKSCDDLTIVSCLYQVIMTGIIIAWYTTNVSLMYNLG